MNNEEMEAAIRSTAKALLNLSQTVNELAERDFAMRAELEATRVLFQAAIATLQCDPVFANRLQDMLKSAVEADHIVSLNSAMDDKLILAREVWLKALTPVEMHINVFPA